MGNGQIVWHDLMTNDITTAKGFYEELLGWRYEIEHASDFAWGSGAADYPLILLHDAAHGGMIQIAPHHSSYWLLYLQVPDVDSATVNAQKCGAKVERPPFDVPGVGRNALLRDPQGALVCPHSPTHAFPPPGGVFVDDLLLTPDPVSAVAFYEAAFGFTPNTRDQNNAKAEWIPVLATTDQEAVSPQQEARLTDPTGAKFALRSVEPEPS